MKANKYPKISIVTPSFNQAKFIERTIKSVLGQDYPNLEYIIKDGGSTDGSLEAIKKYAARYPKIIRWVSKKDKGQADGINQGLKMARGEVLAYLNSDDVYEPKAFERVSEYFLKYPKTLWVTGKCRIVDENDREIRRGITKFKNFWLKNFSSTVLFIFNFISQPATFWQREALRKEGIFDIKKHYTFDYDLWLRLLRFGKPGYIDKYLASFRVHTYSKGKTGFVKQFIEDFQTASENTKNPILLALHFLAAIGIIISYSLINLKSNE